jgi:hypothetical protein
MSGCSTAGKFHQLSPLPLCCQWEAADRPANINAQFLPAMADISIALAEFSNADV